MNTRQALVRVSVAAMLASCSVALASTGTVTYNIAPPAGLPATDPAFNLPSLSGTKSIARQGF